MDGDVWRKVKSPLFSTMSYNPSPISDKLALLVISPKFACPCCGDAKNNGVIPLSRLPWWHTVCNPFCPLSQWNYILLYYISRKKSAHVLLRKTWKKENWRRQRTTTTTKKKKKKKNYKNSRSSICSINKWYITTQTLESVFQQLLSIQTRVIRHLLYVMQVGIDCGQGWRWWIVPLFVIVVIPTIFCCSLNATETQRCLALISMKTFPPETWYVNRKLQSSLPLQSDGREKHPLAVPHPVLSICREKKKPLPSALPFKKT